MKPTDDEILAVLTKRGPTMTAIVRSHLRVKGYSDLQTAFVRRRLVALEKAGKVERAPTAYKLEICWQAYSR